MTRVLSINFELLAGEDGASIVRKPFERTSKGGQFDHRVVEITNEESFAANASAWGVIDTGVRFGTDHHFISRRLMLVEDIVELDETNGIKSAPKGAVYYPFRVHRGWSYEVVCSGTSSAIDAHFKVELAVASGAINSLSEHHNVNCSAVGHGVAFASDRAIFAKDLEEIQAGFKKTQAPVPVLVEWRRIPGRKGYSNSAPVVKQNCTGSLGCEPCSKWAFSNVNWQVPRAKDTGLDWDGDGSPPDVQVTLRTMGGASISSARSQGYKFDWTRVAVQR